MDKSELPSDFAVSDKSEQVNQLLHVDALFWDRDSHGLFDFECKGLTSSKMTMFGCSMLAHEDCQLKPIIPLLDAPETYSPLLSAVYRQGKYWLYNS